MIHHYGVSSPEMSMIVPVLDEGSGPGTGPVEVFYCYVEVRAETQRDAKKLALKDPEFRVWIEQQRSDRGNPFSGLKVQDLECPHGNCWCEDCYKLCGGCKDCAFELKEGKHHG